MRWTRGGGLLLAAVVGLGLVAGPAGAVVQPAEAYVGPAPVAEVLDYVALGDSYSAGPLVPAARTDPSGCFRSTNNYPAYLAGYLQVATYTDVTCSGARTRDFRQPQSLYGGSTARPQLDALSADTDLVTVGIGGNDFGLFGSLIETCPQVRDDDPDGKPCKRTFRKRVDGAWVDTKARDARRVEDRVARALAEVAARAPAAEVYVVGYPRLLPRAGTCEEVPFATGDYDWARHVQWLLNRSLAGAAERAGASYLSTYPATLGHDACAGEEAWINGHVVRLGVAANFHPFQSGLRGVARSVYQQLTGLEAPTNEDAEPPPGSVVVNPVP